MVLRRFLLGWIGAFFWFHAYSGERVDSLRVNPFEAHSPDSTDAAPVASISDSLSLPTPEFSMDSVSKPEDFYKRYISSQDGPHCVFIPSCSRYAKEAIKTHGLILGFFMTGNRLTRCHAYGHGNYPTDPATGKFLDPVPAKPVTQEPR